MIELTIEVTDGVRSDKTRPTSLKAEECHSPKLIFIQILDDTFLRNFFPIPSESKVSRDQHA